MKHLTLALALALTLACGCKKKSGATASGPSCADAINKAVGAMPGGPGAGDVMAQLKELMTRRCTEDAWPPEVIKCYATEVTSMASMKKCREQLPADKQQALMNEIRGVMIGASGAGAGPMHGAPSAAPPHAAGGSAAPAPTGSAATPATAGSAAPPTTGSATPPAQ